MSHFIKKIYDLFLNPEKIDKPLNKNKTTVDYLVIFVIIIGIALYGYQIFKFFVTHTPIEATIIEHIWTDANRLVLKYQYKVDGISYDGQSRSYGEERTRRARSVKRDSATDMQISHPVGSKITAYYQNDKPDISCFSFDDYEIQSKKIF